MGQSEIYQRLQAYLQKQQPFYLELLKQMVLINSFTTNSAGVNALGRLTADMFAELGFEAKTVAATNPMFGHHVVLTRRGRSDNSVGLVSHLDTVFTMAEEEQNNFIWRQEGDRIYGPGTNDIKGGTVMIYMILAALQAVAPEIYEAVTWVVLLNAAEEELAPDFGQLCLQELNVQTLACLVFESGKQPDGAWSLVAARKGRAAYRITVHGKGAHAGSSHQLGANALVQLAHTIQEVAALTDYDRDLTFNVGVAAGGTVINRVPHFASAAVEMRAFSPDVFAEGVASMLALNGQSIVQNGVGNYHCWVDVELLDQTAPWGTNPASESLLEIWQAAAKELGQSVVSEGRGGLSDGNWVWQTIPTLDGLGPVGANSHCSEHAPEEGKEQEYILASSFVPKGLLNIAAILKLIDDRAKI